MMNSIQNAKFTIENRIIKSVEEPFLENSKHNFGQILFKTISKHGNQISSIEVETGEKRSFNEVKDRSTRCALWLKKQGITGGDIVVLCANNQSDTCIPAIAALYVGAAFCSWYYDFNLELYRFYLNFLQPKVIFASESLISIIQEAIKLEKAPTKLIVYGKYPGCESLADIMSQQSPAEVQKYEPDEKENPLDPAVIIFTSGSSGIPKAIALSYDSFLENVLKFCPIGCVTALHYCSVMWIAGAALTFYFLFTGSTVIIHGNKFNSKESLKVIEKYEVNWALINPLGMTQCYKEKILSDYKLPSLKILWTGSAPLSSEVYQAFRDNYPHVNIYMAYGLCELGSLATFNLGDCKSINSIGFIRPNRQLKIMDVTTKKTLGPNEQGEICLKSPGMMTGYYKNPIETKKAIDEEGWLHTGDLGHYDEDGEIFLTGRLKDVMRWRHVYVVPLEIEQLLMRHPEVLEAAVVPVPDDADGDRPMAFVKKSEGSQVTEEELIRISDVGNGVKLWGGVKFIDELPRTATGKLARQQLIEQAKMYKEL